MFETNKKNERSNCVTKKNCKTIIGIVRNLQDDHIYFIP